MFGNVFSEREIWDFRIELRYDFRPEITTAFIFAISTNGSIPIAQKKESLGAKSSICNPALKPARM